MQRREKEKKKNTHTTPNHESCFCYRFDSLIRPNPSHGGVLAMCSISLTSIMHTHTHSHMHDRDALIYLNTVITLMISHGYLKV